MHPIQHNRPGLQGFIAKSVLSRRRMGATVLLAGLLSACGFKLRGDYNYAFTRLAINPNPGTGVALELRRSLGSSVQVLQPGQALTDAQAVLDVLDELREKVVVGVNASGQVREFQLRIRVRFRLRTPQGQELIASGDILQQRDISFSESQVLAKEAEEVMLYRDMQSDIVQQIMRRLAAVKAWS